MSNIAPNVQLRFPVFPDYPDFHSSIQNLANVTNKEKLTLERSLEVTSTLEKILAMDVEEIIRIGIPFDHLVAWKDKFYDELVDYKRMITCETVWAYNEDFSLFKKPVPVLGDMFIALFLGMAVEDRYLSLNDSLSTLYHLYTLHKVVSIPPDNRVEQVFTTFMHCQTERIVSRKPELHGKTFIVLDIPKEYMAGRANVKICCYKKADGRWYLGDINSSPDKPLHVARFNHNNTEILILDKSSDQGLIDRPCIIVEAKRAPHPFEAGESDLVGVSMIYYNGTKNFRQGYRNAYAFGFVVDAFRKPWQMRGFKQSIAFTSDPTDLVRPNQLARVEEDAQYVFEAFQEELVDSSKSLKDLSAHVTFELTPPQSRSDKLWVITHLLLTLEKNPDANAEKILEVAELMDYTMSTKMKKELEAAPSWPKALVTHLLTFTKEQLKAELTEEKEKQASLGAADAKEREEESLPPSPSREQVSSAQDEMERIRCEKQASKAERKARFEEKQRREQAEAKEREDAPSAASEDADTFSLLSPKEQDEVTSIYAGNSSKPRDFAKLVKKILDKVTQGAAAQRKGKGSHQKLHFRQENRPSGGITFRIKHGRDKNREMPSSQKETLNRTFGIFSSKTRKLA